MKIRLFLSILVFLTLFFGACQEEQVVQTASELAQRRAPVSVKSMKAGSQASGASVLLSGTIESKNMAVVSARMMGYVTYVNATVGSKVTAGQTLIRIENNELPAKRAQAGAAIAEAEAALKNVKLNYERIKVLWEQESVTRREWDDVTAQYEMTKAKVEGARQVKRELEIFGGRSIVKAPISGVLASKEISMGDLVNPGIPLMTIEGNKGYEVSSYVSDQHINAVDVGTELYCRIEALDKVFMAKVTEVAPSAVGRAGQYAIKAALQLSTAEKQLVRSGMHANVQLPLAQQDSSTAYTTVSKSAILERGQLKGIYTVSNQNTALLRWIRTGRDFGEQVEVVSGLSLGETYIVSDISEIRDGVSVVTTK